jgi:hypothetical protein|tara:strand:- start:259 stop:636 length:378 start_codon:yes stop_codon:yes gene_type:complete
MVDMTKTRNSIRKVIDNYGSTITITPITISTDKWGDKTESDGTPVETVGISYDYFTARYNFQPIGNMSEGDFIIIVKDDESITTQSGSTIYKMTYNSVNYDVISVEEYEVANVVLAKQVILKKRA